MNGFNFQRRKLTNGEISLKKRKWQISPARRLLFVPPLTAVKCMQNNSLFPDPVEKPFGFDRVSSAVQV
jgi:hypothetical protein